MTNHKQKTLESLPLDWTSLTSTTSLPSEQGEKKVAVSIPSEQRDALDEIEALDAQLLARFKGQVRSESSLTRQIVSFQANKTRSCYRWYKYKEAFSAALVEYLLCEYQLHSGRLLDPFAGSGTTLFAANSKGLSTDGIELLSIGQQIILTKLVLERDFTEEDFASLRHWLSSSP